MFEIPTGAMGDRSGHKKVLARIVLWWSAFTCFSGLATTYPVLLATRYLFGIDEAGAYPNMAGVIARWFPPTERARNQGFISAASRLGGALAPLIVVPLQSLVGWRVTFVILGAVGVVWVICWKALYQDKPQSIAETAAHANVPWARLFRQRQLWLICIIYWCYEWGSCFYFSWQAT
jgi:ACS family glucarate transporter-like MFS transporter